MVTPIDGDSESDADGVDRVEVDLVLLMRSARSASARISEALPFAKA
jgi:hypothetical protein